MMMDGCGQHMEKKKKTLKEGESEGSSGPEKMASTAENSDPIHLDEGIEGEQIVSRNYRFVQVGQSVPIEPPATAADSLYDSQNPPSQPLAVSQRFRLLFIAHSNGFYVARTEEVMASAKDFKEKGSGQSIHDLSIANLSFGRVSILALSSLDSWLAASVANRIHFFSMSALLRKEEEPSFSVGLDASSCIKDVKWARNVEKDYIVLSSTGKLYHGFGRGSLESVLDNVDAVEWSTKGDFVAVARKNVLSIMTSQFKEKRNFSLSPASLIVDSIRWVRADSVVLGSFDSDDDSEQATYVVQVITTKDKDITCASSKPAMVSFCDMFLDYRCDVVPGASGPNLFLSYLENHELAFIANRRNLSQHVVLLGWSLEDKNSSVAMIEISNDAWSAHIDSQGNGDDNLILALSVDKVCQNDGMKFILGEEETEVSPCCILLCVTVDGKLSLFHFVSAAGAVGSPEVFADSDGLEDNCPQVLSEHKLSGISLEVTRQNVEHVSLSLEYNELSRVETNKIQDSNVESGSNQVSPSILKNESKEDSCFGNQYEKSPMSFQTLKGNNQEAFSSTKPKQDRGTQQSESVEKTDLKSEHSPSWTSHCEGPGMKASDSCKTETHAISEVKTHADSLSEKVSADLFRQSVSKSIQAFGSSEFGRRNIPTDLRMSAPSSSVGKFSLLKTSDNRLSSSSSASIMDVISSGISEKSTLHSAGALFQSPSHSKETSSPSVQLSSSGQRAATMIEGSSPACVDSQVLLPENLMSGKSSMPRVTEEKFTTTSQPQRSIHEQKLSIQFSNVEVLVKKMDRLLEGIGGEGGFKDASIGSQECSVAALEGGLWMTSERCRMWRGTLEEQLREIQLLLDKTVPVLARKVYMENIFQQATDSWYSDLWNSQKLSSELELKRQHIVEVDQELASRLVQLERHFNTIELTKFGERGMVQKNQKAIRSGYGKARQQSLRSLQNTTCAQLAAAEKLSEWLSKQMAALSMECQDSKQNVKREVFDTLGLTYDGASYSSSHNEQASDTPRKDLLITSSSVTAKEQCRRNLSTPVKNSEPQTVRRRRDSLSQICSSSVPQKTTVKRIVLQEDRGNGESRLPSEVEEQQLKLQLPEDSASVHSGRYDGSAKWLCQYESKINAKAPVQKSSKPTSTPLSCWTDGLADPGIQVVSARSFPALKEHSSSTVSARLYGARESHMFSGSALGKTSESLSGIDSRYVPQTEICLSATPSIAERIPTVSSKSFKKPIEIPNFSVEELGPSRSAIREVKPTRRTSESFVTDSKLSQKASVSPVPISSSLDSLGKVLNTEIPASKNHPGEKMMSSPVMHPNLRATNQVSSSTPSTSFSKLSTDIKSHTTSLGNLSTSSHAKPDIDQKVSQSHLLLLPSSMSSSTSSLLPAKMDSLSSSAPTLTNGSFESLELGSQLLLPVFGSNEDENSMMQTVTLNSSSTIGEILKTEASVLQPGLPSGSSGSSIGPENPSMPLTELPANLNSENQLDIDGMSSPVSETAPNSILGQQWPSSSNSPAAIPFSGTSLSEKDVSSVNNEDEMEEEAPEGSLTTELALGGLAGFGFGSTSTVMKSNPFGAELPNKTEAPISSLLAMPTPTGELFRPASFNFQSPLPSQPSIAANSSPFPSGFSTGSSSPGPTSSGFGQPAQFGSGQQALGSVLGAFGQSRQLGAISLANSIVPPSGFSSGVSGMTSGGFGGGFSSVASAKGGFASLASGAGAGAGASAGGFAAAATAGGGFATAATAAGGFPAAATAGTGFASGGFGGFGNQVGGSFPTFASSSGAGRPPSELFTQMRK